MRGFPNCYMISVAQAGFTMNFAYLLTLQATHIAYTIERGLSFGLRSMEVSEVAESEWTQKVQEIGDRTTEFARECTPGYYNNEDHPDERGRQNGFYFGEPLEYAEILENWRKAGNLEGLEVIREKAKEKEVE